MTPEEVKGVFVNNKNDVPYGAGASNTPSGYPVNIDARIPQYDPRLLDKTGKPADLWKYLTIHEITEKEAMDQGVPYHKAHKDRATPAERAAVEADGVDWKKYEEVIDGYLSKIEHENPKNPPPDLYLKPYPHDKQKLLEKNIKKEVKLTPVEHNPFEKLPKEVPLNNISSIYDMTPIMKHIINEVKNKNIIEPSNIDIDKLIATQTWLKNDKDADFPFKQYKEPLVAKIGEKHYILDGHHRISRQYLNGEKQTNVHIINIPDDVKNQLTIKDIKSAPKEPTDFRSKKIV